MNKIPVFKDKQGHVLCGEELSGYHESVGIYCKTKNISEENLLEYIIEEKRDETERARKYNELMVKEHYSEIDKIIDENIEKFKGPSKELDYQKIAQVYLAKENGMTERQIKQMIQDGKNSQNMSVIRRGYERGLTEEKVKYYSCVEDCELQENILAGLAMKIPKEYLKMVRDAKSSLVVSCIWKAVKNKAENIEQLYKLLNEVYEEKYKDIDKYIDRNINKGIEACVVLSNITDIYIEHGYRAAIITANEEGILRPKHNSIQ